jgi:hypothetical protein
MKAAFAALWLMAGCMALAAGPVLSEKVEKVALRELEVYRQCAAAALPTPPQRQQIDAAIAAARDSTAAIRRRLDDGQLTAERASGLMAGVAEDLLLRIHGILEPQQFKVFRQKLDAAPRLKLARIDTRLMSAMKDSLDAVGPSDEQRRRAEVLFEKFHQQFDEAYLLYLDGKLSEPAWQARGSAMTRQLVDDCVAVLEPGQQATWALLMAGDMAAPRLRRSLEQFDLSPQQTAKLDGLFNDFKSGYDGLRGDFAARRLEAADFKRQAQELLRKLVNDSQDLLTPEQRKAWDDAVDRARSS